MTESADVGPSWMTIHFELPRSPQGILLLCLLVAAVLLGALLLIELVLRRRTKGRGETAGERFIDFMGPYLDRSVWFRSVPVLGPGLAAAAFGIGLVVHESAAWWWNGGGASVIFVTVLVEWLRESYRGRLRKRDNDAAATLSVSLRNALRPIAKLIAEMQTVVSEDARRAKAETIAFQCADKLKLVMHEVPSFRSVVYRCNEAGDILQVVTWAGRSETPEPEDFSKQEERGKAAFKTLEHKAPVFVRDVTDADEVARVNGELPGVVHSGARAGYKTFIAAPVVIGQSEYGMITVDAAEPGDLLKSEKYLVQVVADMLAIAVASIRETPTIEQ